MEEYLFPIVQGHFEKVSDLRYSEPRQDPVTWKQWVNRDLLFIYSLFIIKVGFR